MVQEAIQDQLDAQQARTLITADRILREYGRIGFLDTRKLFDENGALKKITELDIDTQAAIAGIDVVTTGNAELGVGEITKIKIADRKGALDSMARCLMMFNDKLALTGANGGPIEYRNVQDMSDDELARIAAGTSE